MGHNILEHQARNLLLREGPYAFIDVLNHSDLTRSQQGDGITYKIYILTEALPLRVAQQGFDPHFSRNEV